MVDTKEDFEAIRQIYTVLTLHFLEEMKQSDIAAKLNLSTSKVNRLIAQGRKLGMIKIAVESPFKNLVEMEQAFLDQSSLTNALVTPAIAGNPDTNLQNVGRAAANLLLETIRDGDVIAITGGKAVSAVVESLNAEREFNVTVVPLTGGVQGKFYTDVNHLATQLAERLGGQTMLMHAPLFAESREQRDMLMEMGSIRQVFDLARQASVALVGIGSIQSPASSYFDLQPMSIEERESLISGGVSGEFLAHLIDEFGQVADNHFNSRLVALNPQELALCPKVIGIASGDEKVGPLHAALTGRLLKSLVVDENTAAKVLSRIAEVKDVA